LNLDDKGRRRIVVAVLMRDLLPEQCLVQKTEEKRHEQKKMKCPQARPV
jgi:hypothetical protein